LPANDAVGDDITREETHRALPMPLLGSPKSPLAELLVQEIFDEIVRPAMYGLQPRPSSIAKSQQALGALLGDLCRYQSRDRFGKHGMGPADFSLDELGFARTSFVGVTSALQSAELLRFKVGWNFTDDGLFGVFRHGGEVSTFALSPGFIDRLGELCGPDANDHWSHGRPRVRPDEPLITLKAQRVGTDDAAELAYSFFDEPEAALIKGRINHLNTFLEGRVDGIAFAGLRRIYNDGDVEGKRWRRGGRYYSLKHAEQYELTGEAARVKSIRVDNETVHEVDISASHLTVLHGLLGLPFAPGAEDPYACGDVHREAVKAFVTTSLGRGNLSANRWYPRSLEAYAAKCEGRKLNDDYTVAEVRSAALGRYPFLAGLEELAINSLDLQWHEAEILTVAMMQLIKQDIASLPVHDALLVPASKLEEGKRALRSAFANHFKTEEVVPAFSVTYGGPEALDL
jgi:hypothetical protein